MRIGADADCVRRVGVAPVPGSRWTLSSEEQIDQPEIPDDRKEYPS